MTEHKLSMIHVEYSIDNAPIYHCIKCGVVILFDRYLKSEPKNVEKNDIMYVISGSKNYDEDSVMKYLVDNEITCNTILIYKTMIE